MTEAKEFGDYQLLRKLGEGAVGDVFLARHRDTPLSEAKPVVIKRLKPEHAETKDVVSRFLHEATLAAMVNSPHVARVYESGTVNDTLFLALEYVPGWPLSRLVNEAHRVGLELSLDAIVTITQGILSGLSDLHAIRHPETGESMQVVHRDIAPKNIMVSPDGRVCLIDLGLGRSPLRDGQTRAGVIMGSPGYMAPEQIQGKSVDARVDIYATGVILWEMLSGQRWVNGTSAVDRLLAQLDRVFEPPSTFQDRINSALDAVCACALKPRPQQRFESARAFAEALADSHSPSDNSDLLALVLDLAHEEMLEETTRVTQMVQKMPVPAVTSISDPAEVTAETRVLESQPDLQSIPEARQPIDGLPLSSFTQPATPSSSLDGTPFSDPASLTAGHPGASQFSVTPGNSRAHLFLAAAVLLAVSFVAGAVFTRARAPAVDPAEMAAPSAATPVTPGVRPAVQASVQATPKPVAVEEAAAQTPKSPTGAQLPPTKAHPLPVKRRPPPRLRKAPPPSASSKTPQDTSEVSKQKLARMLVVVRLLAAREDLPTDLRQRARNLKTDIQLEMRALSPAKPRSKKLPEIEARLRALKAAAAS